MPPWPFSPLAAAAVLRENLLYRAPTVPLPSGKPCCRGSHVDVPQLDFVRVRGTSEIEGVSRSTRRGSYRTRKELLSESIANPPSPSMLQVCCAL